MKPWYRLVAILALALLVAACLPTSGHPPVDGNVTASAATSAPTAAPTPQASLAAPTATRGPTPEIATREAGQTPGGAPTAAAILPTPPSLFAPAPGAPLPVAGAGVNLALGDLNRDGMADLAASGSGNQLIVLLGQADGRLRAAAGSPFAVPLPPSELALGDVDGDQALDLAFVSHDSHDVTLLLGDGAGGLAVAPQSPIRMQDDDGQPPHTHGLDLGDFNGDGRLDLATLNSHRNEIAVAFGDGRGVFRRAPGSPYALGADLYLRALGDLNGDRHLDFVTTGEGESIRTITLALGDGRGGFRRSSITPRTVRPWLAAIGDVNGDGRPDLVVTHAERNELTVLLGDGRGAFAEASGSPFDLGRTGWRPVIADLDRDGKPDVAAAAGDGVGVLLGDGQGRFVPAPGSPFATGPGPWRTLVGDVNGDGKPDIVTSHLDGGIASVLLGR